MNTGDDEVWIAATGTAVVGVSRQYAVAVPAGEVGAGFACGYYSGFEELSIVALAQL